MTKLIRQSILWITNGWEDLDHPKDTSLRLMQECLKIGARTFWGDFRTIHSCNGESHLTARAVLGQRQKLSKRVFEFAAPMRCRADDFDTIVYRVDPPIDNAYRHFLQILSRGVAGESSKKTTIINSPEVLLGSTSKIEALAMRAYIPPTLVDSQWEPFLNFGKSTGTTVAKPLHNCNRAGISWLTWSNRSEIRRSQEVLRLLTAGFREPVVLQQQVDGSDIREFRCWYANGAMVASARRDGCRTTTPYRAESFRVSPMNTHEKEVGQAIGDHLRNRRIHLAAADILNGYLLDLNFASPGLVVELERCLKTNVSRRIVETLLDVGDPRPKMTSDRQGPTL